MIQIRRGHQPAKLLVVRSKKLSEVATYVSSGTLERKHINGYDIVKEELWRRQQYKCCYCERNNLEPSHSDVEHFRPAMKAARGDGFPTHGYWWLAWTWSNLLFSCKVCNGTAKGHQFPLDAGSEVLATHQQPPGRELPLLIDPCSDDPMRHIRFEPVSFGGRRRWVPVPRSPKGQTTIRILKLARPPLLDLYERHVDHHVAPSVKRLETLIRSRDRSLILAEWEKGILSLTKPDRPFTALSYDAIGYFVSISIRRAWHLPLRRPS